MMAVSLPRVTCQLCVVHARKRTTDASALSVAVNNNNAISPSLGSRQKSIPNLTETANKNKDRCPGTETKAKIPKPRGVPLLGNVRDFLGSFGSTAHTFLQRRAKQLGPIYEFSALGEKMVFLFDYTDISALRKAEGDFPEHIEFRHLKKYRQEKNLPLGVLISTGEEWIGQRRMLAAPMLKPEFVANYFEGLKQVTNDALSYHLSGLEGNTWPDIENVTGKFAFEGIGRAILGVRLGCFSEQDPKYLKRFVYLARRNFQDARQLLITPDSLWRFLPAWDRHNEGWNYILDVARYHVDKQLDTWENSGTVPDDCVLGALHMSGQMSRDELHVNIADLLLAAIDTTASAILWAMYELSRHPEVQEEIFKEYNATQGEQLLTYKQLHSLKYLRAVLKETLRLHPVAFFTSRITTHQAEIQGYEIPPKTHVACSMYVMGRDATIFPDPNQFRPSRWLDSQLKNGAFFAKVPFGSGVRMCLGRRIAETEILLFLLEMAKAFRIEAESTLPIEPTFRILMVPKTSLKLRFIPRK